MLLHEFLLTSHIFHSLICFVCTILFCFTNRSSNSSFIEASSARRASSDTGRPAGAEAGSSDGRSPAVGAPAAPAPDTEDADGDESPDAHITLVSTISFCIIESWRKCGVLDELKRSFASV